MIVAKEPVPGRVKTRLSPPLSPEEAAGIYEHFLCDTLGEMTAIPGVDSAIAYTPTGAEKTFLSLVEKRFLLFPQQGKDLGERLLNIFKEKLFEGYEAVSIISSDTPDLPKEKVQESFCLLRSNQAEVVFGPCEDGGYYLVGMKRVFPELFVHIPWSTEKVLSISMEKAKRMNLNVGLLAPWKDIDTYEELVSFYRKYRETPRNSPWAGEKTFSFLSGLEKFRVSS